MSSTLMPKDLQPVVAAILTGGQARRFHGLDKSALVVPAVDGAARPIFDRQLDALASIAARILVVTSAARAHEFPSTRIGPSARVVLDGYPGLGPLGAVVTALDAEPHAPLLVIAGDMPHVSPPLLAALVERHARARAHATVPESSRGLEPLCAVYAPAARPPLSAALASGDLSLQSALRRLDIDVMPATEVAAFGNPDTLFRNINAPGDLAL